MVSEEGISTYPDKVKAVQDWPRPKTTKQTRGLSWSLLLLQEICETLCRPLHKLCDKASRLQWNDECEQAFIRLKEALTSPGRQHNNADALSLRPCKVCLRHQERNTDEKSEPEFATTIEQVRVSTGSKQSHSVDPNLMNSEILKNWEPEEIRESELNDKQIKFLYNCISDY